MAVRNRDDDDDEDRPRKKSRPRDDDDDDDRPRRKRSRRSEDDDERDDGGVGVVIPYRNGMALTAYYLAIFGLIPCVSFGILGIVPVILGIMGLKKAQSDPNARGSAHAWVGIVLGSLEVLAGCVVGGLFIFRALQGGRR